MKNILLTIAYDGSGFHGWQRQLNTRTVQGELEKSLHHCFNRDITVDGTSRTDAGVHALGQRATFSHDLNIPVEKLPLILNNSFSRGRIFDERLPGDICILAAEEVEKNFHARFDAVGKKYIYRIRCGTEKDLFIRNYRHQLITVPDLDAMREAAQYITGTQDFKSFETSGGAERESTVRTIYSLNVKSTSDGTGWTDIDVEIIGDGFLYNMVRIIVGTLIEVGIGRRTPRDVRNVIEACDREAAGHTAPACGLYLAEVYYDKGEITNSSGEESR